MLFRVGDICITSYRDFKVEQIIKISKSIHYCFIHYCVLSKDYPVYRCDIDSYKYYFTGKLNSHPKALPVCLDCRRFCNQRCGLAGFNWEQLGEEMVEV